MTAINVKGIPESLVDFILKTQHEQKMKTKQRKYSQAQTVIHIIKEYKNVVEKL